MFIRWDALELVLLYKGKFEQFLENWGILCKVILVSKPIIVFPLT